MWREWDKKNAYRLLVANSEGKGPLGRSRRRWMDNTKAHLGETVFGWRGMDWADLGLIQVESSCAGDDKLSGSIECWRTIEWLHNWRLLEKCSAP
jgi:hypothetical protein